MNGYLSETIEEADDVCSEYIDFLIQMVDDIPDNMEYATVQAALMLCLLVNDIGLTKTADRCIKLYEKRYPGEIS